MKLEALITVNGGEPLHATGSCTRTMMESIGLDPVYFREQGGIITNFRWLVSHDGPKPEHQPEEPKKRARISGKRMAKLQEKYLKYTKE